MRGMKAQGISRDTLPFKAVSLRPSAASLACSRPLTHPQPFQPYLTYFSLVFTCLVSFFKGFDAFMPFDYKNFITSYIGIPVYIFGYIGYKREFNSPTLVAVQGRIMERARRSHPVLRRTSYVRMDEMDLTSGAREFHDIDEEEEEDEELAYKAMNWKQKIVYKLSNW